MVDAWNIKLSILCRNKHAKDAILKNKKMGGWTRFLYCGNTA